MKVPLKIPMEILTNPTWVAKLTKLTNLAVVLHEQSEAFWQKWLEHSGQTVVALGKAVAEEDYTGFREHVAEMKRQYDCEPD